MLCYLKSQKGETMNKFINKLIRHHLGAYMDKSRDKLAFADKIYQRDVRDSGKLEERYNALELGKRERLVINDYIACLMTREHRMADISYMAGVGDTVKFLNAIGLLRASKNKHFKKCLKKL